MALPCADEYISAYINSVQTAYITSVECLVSSNYYVNNIYSSIGESNGIPLVNISHSELLSSDLSDTVQKGIDNILKSLNNDETIEWNERLYAVAYMTSNYYSKNNVKPTDTRVQFGDAADATTAKTLLITREIEASMDEFISKTKLIKEFYINNKIKVDKNNVGQEEFSKLVMQYYRGREEVLSTTFAKTFSAIRGAFIYGSGINACNGSPKTDDKLLVCK